MIVAGFVAFGVVVGSMAGVEGRTSGGTGRGSVGGFGSVEYTDGVDGKG